MLSHLLELSLVNLDPKRKKKILKDLEKILDYFSLIKEIESKKQISQKIEFFEENLREDQPKELSLEQIKKLLKLAPEKEKNYFKTNPIF